MGQVDSFMAENYGVSLSDIFKYIHWKQESRFQNSIMAGPHL